jgi:hypothetical protein
MYKLKEILSAMCVNFKNDEHNYFLAATGQPLHTMIRLVSISTVYSQVFAVFTAVMIKLTEI